ncbi:Tyrosine-protein kinase YwqD [Pseudobythopirellula maris]|uniref:Tyrosine-protein kinase YwqD n=1 Tax=Pseudobythopirellula maris TaxID=2527991 RepID=A0A5C5ZRV6_9BACT|nr:CpsD/CapB family tyrosine-protein kinase [Pseudobythopirellula maris]TWT90244.1 Tyrosine-protein kinase YwqD [Pseudobythopirellula maris]
MASPTADTIRMEPPSDSGAKRSPLVPRRRGAEPYDTVLWRLQSRVEQRHGAGFLVGVTSCMRRAGVSTLAANLAIRAADHQLTPALLVDCNAAHPQVDREFRLQGARGLADLLAGECELEEAVHPTNVEGLEVMPLGTTGLIDRASVEPRRLEGLVRSLGESHEYVVFDLPPADDMRHALLVAKQLDAVLMAVGSEVTPRGLAKKSIDLLRSDGVSFAGAVVTRQKKHVPGWFGRML